MTNEGKQAATSAAAFLLILGTIAAASWYLGPQTKTLSAQGDYPRVIIEGKADSINGGLPRELAIDNHGVPLGNSVSTFNASQGGAIGQTAYAVGQPQPQWTQQIGEQVHITGTAATAVKASSGILVRLIIGTGAAGTVSIFDLASASCTATPSTNTVSVITAAATTIQSAEFDTHFLNGICVKASAAMDLTAVYQ
jgi:hypothetical protein